MYQNAFVTPTKIQFCHHSLPHNSWTVHIDDVSTLEVEQTAMKLKDLRVKCEITQSSRAPTTIPTATPSTTISNTPATVIISYVM